MGGGRGMSERLEKGVMTKIQIILVPGGLQVKTFL